MCSCKNVYFCIRRKGYVTDRVRVKKECACMSVHVREVEKSVSVVRKVEKSVSVAVSVASSCTGMRCFPGLCGA